MTNYTVHNFTEHDLQEANEQTATLLVPAMLYVAIAMLLSFPGNLLVCFVFIRKIQTGTQNFLITCLAIFDLLSSILAMPVEIADMRYYYTFSSEFACKLLRFMNALCSLSSIVTLLAIAVDRYLRVCRPMNTQMKLRDAKIFVIVAVVAGLVFSWPALIIYGLRTAETEVPGLYGKDCSTSDSIKDTLYPVIYHGILAFGFISLTVVLAVLYGLICLEAKRHKRYMKNSCAGKGLSKMQSISVSSVQPDTSIAALSSCDITDSASPEKESKKLKSHSSHKMKDKTTVIGFLVTLVFILSYLPFLILMGTRSLIQDFDHDLRGAALVFFNIFIRSYFVNCAVNPIIYGALNYRFRKESIELVHKMFCFTKRNSETVQQTSSQ